MTGKNTIKVAIITGAHGIKGQLRIKPLCEDPEALADYAPFFDAKGTPLPITLHSLGGQPIGTLANVTNRNEAEKLKGTEVYASRTSLPALEAGESYAQDLLGLQAVGESGKALGEVIGVHNYGAGDILELRLTDGEQELYPYTAAFFGDIDATRRTILFFPPEE